jgi:hypothetical protein
LIAKSLTSPAEHVSKLQDCALKMKVMNAILAIIGVPKEKSWFWQIGLRNFISLHLQAGFKPQFALAYEKHIWVVFWAFPIVNLSLLSPARLRQMAATVFD